MTRLQTWFALNIGNSRLHWARFVDDRLQTNWDTSHESPEAVQQWSRSHWEELWIASVVPEQTALWQMHPNATLLTLDSIPVPGLYPTIGIDRALALWGAMQTIGGPVLVIDAGTALTFTAANKTHFVGGAILPGLRLQVESLGHKTALLPEIQFDEALPKRWATTTPDAIASGILHTVLAGVRSFLEDWWRQFPASPVILTGGDSDRLHRYLTQQKAISDRVQVNRSLIFLGMQAARSGRSISKEP